MYRFFFFKQKTSYEMRISDWSPDVCSSDLLEAAGAEVTVIDYLKAPPSAADLKALYARAGMTPREGLRTAETGAKALTPADDDAILAAMTADPILIERPLVATAKGVVLGRPPAHVRETLLAAAGGSAELSAFPTIQDNGRVGKGWVT